MFAGQVGQSMDQLVAFRGGVWFACVCLWSSSVCVYVCVCVEYTLKCSDLCGYLSTLLTFCHCIVVKRVCGVGQNVLSVEGK